MQDDVTHDWPGKADGVPRPPTPAELDETSAQQELITDEWAPAPPTEHEHPSKRDNNPAST
jgi:hypothetical protein